MSLMDAAHSSVEVDGVTEGDTIVSSSGGVLDSSAVSNSELEELDLCALS